MLGRTISECQDKACESAERVGELRNFGTTEGVRGAGK